MCTTHSSVWTDERGDTDDAAISEELGHLSDTADVLLTVLLGEAEVLVQAVTDVVSVKTGRRRERGKWDESRFLCVHRKQQGYLTE